MKKYRIEVIDKRDRGLVYKHSTNNIETFKKLIRKYFRESNTYPFYCYETFGKYYVDEKEYDSEEIAWKFNI